MATSTRVTSTATPSFWPGRGSRRSTPCSSSTRWRARATLTSRSASATGNTSPSARASTSFGPNTGSVDYVLSEPDEAWAGLTDHVQDHPDALGGVEDTDFYVCGVPDVVVDTADPFGSEGVDEEHVYTEGRVADAVED